MTGMETLELQRTQMAVRHGEDISRLAEDALDCATDSDSALIVKISTTGRTLLDAETWFSGFSAKIAMLDGVEDAIADRIIIACSAAQEKTQQIFRQYQGIADKHSHIEVRNVADMACESASILYNTLEKLRWEMLDRQADNDIAAGRVSEAFSSVEDLLNSLKS